jgi:hypothetical protein
MALSQIAEWAFEYLKSCAPVDTGNLKENAIQIIQSAPEEYQIIIDSSIAPYAVYTNEKWISPQWRGKKNPNEKWIDKAVNHIAQRLCDMLDGRITTREGMPERWDNKKYWLAVQRGEITRNDNIIAIDGTVRKDSE